MTTKNAVAVNVQTKVRLRRGQIRLRLTPAHRRSRHRTNVHRTAAVQTIRGRLVLRHHRQITVRPVATVRLRGQIRLHRQVAIAGNRCL